MFDIISFIPRAVVQGVPLLYGSTGEILTEKSGNLNLGIPGIMYVGGICGVIGSFFYENSLPSKADISALPAILIPIVCCLLGSLLMGLLYCLLTVTLRANQNVTVKFRLLPSPAQATSSIAHCSPRVKAGSIRTSCPMASWYTSRLPSASSSLGS